MRWAAGVLVFLVAEAALRLYWIAGGRWGYTACDRTALPADPSGGCGAGQVTEVPFWSGWGALILFVALAGVIRWRPVPPVLWAGAAAVGVAAFPLHLLFEVPAALTGRPSDWRDLLGRLALVTGAVLLAGLANAVTPPRAPVTARYQPVPAWTHRWAYAALALPLIGWAVPHALWVLGVPFGISAADLDDVRADMSLGAALAITVVPPLAGLFVLGLVQRWGQQFPRWVPMLHGRRVPPLLALVPAGVVAAALVTYGLLSMSVLVRSLVDGSTTRAQLADGWAVTATLLVFAGWGVALAGTAVGYHLATRAPKS
jgi:hypothetical protein